MRRRKIAAADGMPCAAFNDADWSRIEVLIPALLVLLAAGYVVGKVAAGEGAAERDEDPRVRQVAGGVRRANAADGFAGKQRTADAVGQGDYEDDPVRQEAAGAVVAHDVITRDPAFRQHQVIKVENLDVLQALKLKPRHGFRYSIEELVRRAREMDRQIELAAVRSCREADSTQKKFVEWGGSSPRFGR